MKQPVLVLHVPVPPSANRMFQRRLTRRGKRNLTPEYKAWRDEAGWLANMELVSIPRIDCRFDVVIEVPISRRRDTDNYIKPLLDLCQNIGAISNDGNQRSVTITPTARTDCMIALTPLPDEPGIRKPVKPRMSLSSPKPRQIKPTQAQVARLLKTYWAPPAK